MSKLPMTPIRTGGKPARASVQRLEIDGLAFDVHRSDRRKTIEITVERSGDLSIVAPSTVPVDQLVSFVEEKLVWVHTKVEEKARLQRRAPRKEFVEGEGFLYLGRSYRLRLVDNQLVDLSLTNGRFCLRRSSIHRGRDIFVSWYTHRAQQWFEKQVTELSNRMGGHSARGQGSRPWLQMGIFRFRRSRLVSLESDPLTSTHCPVRCGA